MAAISFLACCKKTTPALVSCTSLLLRNRSSLPSCFSKLAMRLEMAGCVMCNFSAAFEKEPSSAVKIKLSMEVLSMCIPISYQDYKNNEFVLCERKSYTAHNERYSQCLIEEGA